MSEVSPRTSGECPLLSPSPACGEAIRRAEPGEKPKGSLTRTGEPGEAKAGRANASESPALHVATSQPPNTGATAASGRMDRGYPVDPAGRTPPRPRRIGDAHPGRIFAMRKRGTPTRSAASSRPTARKAEPLGGRRKPKKRKPVAERQGETITRRTGPRPRSRRYPPERELTWAGGSPGERGEGC